MSSGNDQSGASFITAKRSITDNSPKIDDLLEGSSNKKNIQILGNISNKKKDFHSDQKINEESSVSKKSQEIEQDNLTASFEIDSQQN